ncbi:hypothetical protein Ro103_29 [Escherichia phage vB_EcoP-Ro103C3lw]|nr:hypothetical protein Ro103_29 [Escherichia phage vB_EcoP-Ro103C3lw]
MSKLNSCLCCGVRMSGVEESNGLFVKVVKQLIKTSLRDKDSKALLMLVRELSARIDHGVTRYSEQGETGSLCGSQYANQIITKLISEAADGLVQIEEHYKHE